MIRKQILENYTLCKAIKNNIPLNPGKSHLFFFISKSILCSLHHSRFNWRTDRQAEWQQNPLPSRCWI